MSNSVNKILKIFGFIVSVLFLGTAIAKGFKLSISEWIAFIFWFVGIGMYLYSTIIRKS
ncbi:hypothetical protein OW763_16475 [Clostridium aestuarii]|uniref:Uncharacterized protein n=1 Tax=Clostridium aestuarii TaxID=338193 RepID=A0ABT4D3U1_9CLOT|nr:hypothetical protein [Clostridium aestuarii]MCY6485908.1 hypothetical protein [Clostridium aestuarii]